jgi:hypothetical protein
MNMLALADDSFGPAVDFAAVLVVEFEAGAGGEAASHPLADRFPHIVFARVDPVRAPATAAMFGLIDEAALLIFRDQIVLYFERGEHRAERTAGLLAQVCALDMGRVRAAIEEEKRAELALRMRRVCPTARRGRLDLG